MESPIAWDAPRIPKGQRPRPAHRRQDPLRLATSDDFPPSVFALLPSWKWQLAISREGPPILVLLGPSDRSDLPGRPHCQYALGPLDRAAWPGPGGDAATQCALLRQMIRAVQRLL